MHCYFHEYETIYNATNCFTFWYWKNKYGFTRENMLNLFKCWSFTYIKFYFIRELCKVFARNMYTGSVQRKRVAIYRIMKVVQDLHVNYLFLAFLVMKRCINSWTFLNFWVQLKQKRSWIFMNVRLLIIEDTYKLNGVRIFVWRTFLL